MRCSLGRRASTSTSNTSPIMLRSRAFARMRGGGFLLFVIASSLASRAFSGGSSSNAQSSLSAKLETEWNSFVRLQAKVQEKCGLNMHKDLSWSSWQTWYLMRIQRPTQIPVNCEDTTYRHVNDLVEIVAGAVGFRPGQIAAVINEALAVPEQQAVVVRKLDEFLTKIDTNKIWFRTRMREEERRDSTDEEMKQYTLKATFEWFVAEMKAALPDVFREAEQMAAAWRTPDRRRHSSASSSASSSLKAQRPLYGEFEKEWNNFKALQANVQRKCGLNIHADSNWDTWKNWYLMSLHWTDSPDDQVKGLIKVVGDAAHGVRVNEVVAKIINALKVPNHKELIIKQLDKFLQVIDSNKNWFLQRMGESWEAARRMKMEGWEEEVVRLQSCIADAQAEMQMYTVQETCSRLLG